MEYHAAQPKCWKQNMKTCLHEYLERETAICGGTGDYTYRQCGQLITGPEAYDLARRGILKSPTLGGAQQRDKPSPCPPASRPTDGARGGPSEPPARIGDL